MTEQVYDKPLESLKSNLTPAPVKIIPLLEQGQPVLENINEVNLVKSKFQYF